MSAVRSGYRAVQLLDFKHHKIPNTFLLFNVGKRKMRPQNPEKTLYNEEFCRMNEFAETQYNKSIKHIKSLAS
jgi:hypothetical protein